MAADPLFAFVQLEFGFPLGPRDGRFILRAAPGAAPERVLVLGTLEAPGRRGLLKARRGQTVEQAAPEPVPTSRATVINPEPHGSAEEPARWLSVLQSDRPAADAELSAALARLNSGCTPTASPPPTPTPATCPPATP